MPDRPLSPHLTIYKMSRYSLLSSFSNRLAGLAASVGFVLLVDWLVAAARGAQVYAHTAAALSTPLAKAVFAVLLLAVVYHLLAGIRHLVWDTGRGLERAQSRRSAWLIAVLTLILASALAYWAFLARSGGA
jgi:succinate dehydrogenase / fumarate reductase cytochrome b subunit